jgi:hypothetical protein
MADKKPLWRIAEEAWWGKVDTDSMDDPLIAPPENEQWADVFRALADEVDEVVPPECRIPSEVNSDFVNGFNYGADNMKNTIIQRLLDAAAEAEGGSSDG